MAGAGCPLAGTSKSKKRKKEPIEGRTKLHVLRKEAGVNEAKERRGGVRGGKAKRIPESRVQKKFCLYQKAFVAKRGSVS